MASAFTYVIVGCFIGAMVVMVMALVSQAGLRAAQWKLENVNHYTNETAQFAVSKAQWPIYNPFDWEAMYVSANAVAQNVSFSIQPTVFPRPMFPAYNAAR